MKSQANTQLLEMLVKVIAPPLPTLSPELIPQAELLMKDPVKLLLSVVPKKTIAPPEVLTILDLKSLPNLLLFALL